MPGRVAQEQQRQVEGVAQLHEARGLVGAVAVDRAAEVRRVVGDERRSGGPRCGPARSPCRARSGGAARAPSRCRRASRSPRARRRRAAGSPGSTLAQQPLVGARPSRRAGPGSTTRYCFATRTASASSATATSTTPFGTCTSIGPTSSGRKTPRPPPSIIAGPPMPMFESRGRDDDVAAAEQRGVAGEAAARARCRPAAPGRSGARRGGRPCVSRPGDAERVGVAGPAAAALGEEHDRQAPLLGELEHAVLLAVVLQRPACRRARCSRRTSRRSARARRRTASPLTRPMPATRPSAGVRSIRSSSGRRRRCAAIASGPYSTKLPGSQRSSMFSRAVRWPGRAPARDRVGPGRVERERAWRSMHLGQVGRGSRRDRPPRAPAAPPRPTSRLLDERERTRPRSTVSPDGDRDAAARCRRPAAR